MNLKLALFGGSFDPIHNGHLAIAEQAKLAFELDEIHFILAKQSPFKVDKSLAESTQEKSQELRLKILKTALSETKYQKLNFKAIDIELQRPSPSYSCDTVKYYRESYPEARLFWIMGEDNYCFLNQWKNYQYLLDNLEFIVLRRVNLDRNQNKPLNLTPELEAKTHFLQNPYYQISSTEVREAVIQEKKLDFLAENLP